MDTQAVRIAVDEGEDRDGELRAGGASEVEDVSEEDASGEVGVAFCLGQLVPVRSAQGRGV